MKKLFAFFIAALIVAGNLVAFSYVDTPVNMLVNGTQVSFAFSPLIRDGVTYVDAKTLSSSLGLSYREYSNHESVVISNSHTSVCIVPGEQYATVSDLTGTSDKEFVYRFLSGPGIYIGDHFAVAARDVAEIFGYSLGYDQASATVYFGYVPSANSAPSLSSVDSHTYYFQNQAEFGFPGHGSGYCWVCSYAMVITDATGRRVTPKDVAAVNLTKTSSGAYCYHGEIVKAFNVRFVSALPVTSPYYGGRDGISSGTFIKNPQKDDNVVRAAIREALTLHPEGVMVRYAAFPHTMVAVATRGDLILFNDPAPTSGSSYSNTGIYNGVTFSQTCVGMRGFRLSDITFIQAID